MKQAEMRARLSLIVSMCNFGTIGLLRRSLPVSSGFLAMLRGLLGALFLLLVLRLRGMRLSRESIRENLIRLCLSGALIGFNWILLFEAYRFTTVATATLCYYMAPLFTLAAAPLVLREHMTARKLLCLAAALFGMVLVSGVTRTGFSGASEWRGVLLALGAAALYASIVLINKTIHGIDAFGRTILQLGVAGIVLIPYVLLTEDLSRIVLTPTVVFLLLAAGFVYTGLAYALYFSSMDDLSAQTLALLSYLDPVVAVVLSALLLHEAMTGSEWIGALLILCAAVAAELPDRNITTHKEEKT